MVEQMVDDDCIFSDWRSSLNDIWAPGVFQGIFAGYVVYIEGSPTCKGFLLTFWDPSGHPLTIVEQSYRYSFFGFLWR